MMQNKTWAIFAALAIILAAAVVYNYTGKPSEQDCINVHFHNVRIVASDPDIPEGLREIMLQSITNKQIAPGVVDSCIQYKSRSRLKCELNASSMAELKACMKAGK